MSWFLLAPQSMGAEVGLAGEQERVHQLFKVLKLGFLPACNQTESFGKFSMASCLHVPRSWGQSTNLPQQAGGFRVHVSAMSISSPLFPLCCLPKLPGTFSLLGGFPSMQGSPQPLPAPRSPSQPRAVTLRYSLLRSD